LCIDARLSDDVTRALQEKSLNCIIKALRIEFISFNLSSLEKGCLRFERFRLALFKNRRKNKMRE